MPARFANKKAFLATFKTTGSIKKAAKAAGIRRELHSRWLKRDPAYAAEFEAVCAGIADRRAEPKPAVGREDELRAQIVRLQQRVSELGRELRQKIRDVEAKVSAGPPRERQAKDAAATALLDQIARGMANKPFSKLSSAHQDAVRQIAARIAGEQAD